MKNNLTDLYIANIIANEISKNNVTHEEEKADYGYDDMFKCDEPTQLALIDKALNKNLLFFLNSSEDSQKDIECNRHFLKEKKTLLLVCHSDFGGDVGFLFATDDEYDINTEEFVNDNSYTKIIVKVITKELAIKIFNSDDSDEFFRPFWK